MDALLFRSSWSPPAAAPLRLRASWSPAAAVAAASNRARPAARHLIQINPGRRDVYLLATVKVQARTRGAFRSHCRADQFAEPEPEREDVDELGSAESSKNPEGKTLREQARKNSEAFRAAMRARVAPDVFLKEKNQITNNYMSDMSLSGVDILNVNATVLAKHLGARVKTALDLASKVMGIANVGLGTTQNSEDTANQMVRTYISTFLNVAEDAYHKRVDMEAAIVSFLVALRGLVAICHTIVEGTVDKLEDGPLKDSITCGMDGHAQEYSKQMNNLLDKFMEAMISGAYEIVTGILLDETLDEHNLYLLQLMECRKAALLSHIKG